MVDAVLPRGGGIFSTFNLFVISRGVLPAASVAGLRLRGDTTQALPPVLGNRSSGSPGRTYYIVHDNTLNGCTIVTTEPSDEARYKVMGRYNSEAEAEKAIASMKGC
jgi:hypothetical protein